MTKGRKSRARWKRSIVDVMLEGCQPQLSLGLPPYVGVVSPDPFPYGIPNSEPVARTTDPGTSHIAARIAGRKVRESQLRVLEALAAGPMTDEEMQLALMVPMSLSGSRTRRKELTRTGMVAATGRTRPTALGNPSNVWQITEYGLAWLQSIGRGKATQVCGEQSPTKLD